MPSIVVNLSDKTYARIVEYARNEAGTIPERAARDILDNFLAEDYERMESGEPLSDGDDGFNTMINPEYAGQRLTARQVEQEYGLEPGTVRSYIRFNRSRIGTDFIKIDGRTWGMSREIAHSIWGRK